MSSDLDDANFSSFLNELILEIQVASPDSEDDVDS
jgi:hypothetical protein